MLLKFNFQTNIKQKYKFNVFQKK